MPYIRYESFSAALGWDGEATPTDTQIEQILEIARPSPSTLRRCRLAAIDAVRLVAKCAPRTEALGKTKKQLINLLTCLKRTRVAAKQLPPGWFDDLEPKDFLHDLDRIYRNAELLESKIVVTRGGGAKAKRADAFRKRLAAEHAFDLLNDYGCGPGPSLTKGGAWFELANFLFLCCDGATWKM